MSDQDRVRVAVLFGGRSTEHEISIITGLQVLDAIDSSRFDAFPVYIDQEGFWFIGEELRNKENYLPSSELKEKLTKVQLTCDAESKLVSVSSTGGWFSKSAPKEIPVDVFFSAFHGTFGEDGCIQGVLEFVGADYTGSGIRACSIGMNKFASKMLLACQDIASLPDLLINRKEWDPNRADLMADKVLDHLSLPLIVKPCNLGSSIGVSSAKSKDELMVSMAGAFAFDNQIVIENLLEDFYELNVSVLHGDPPRISAIERPVREDFVLTFEEKYMKGNNKKISSSSAQGMAAMKRDLNPEDVPDEIKQSVIDYSIKAFKALDCRGVVRFDYLIDKSNDEVFFNEINLLPGSFSYYLWEKAEPALTFTELLTIMIEQAQEEGKAKRRIQRKTRTKIFTEA